MSRLLFNEPCEHHDGTPDGAADLTLYSDASSGSLASIYAAITGGSALSNPYSVGASAQATVYVDSTTLADANTVYVDAGDGVRIGYALATPTASTQWYNGTSAPSGGTGSTNDFYINTTNGDLWRKLSGTWTLLMNIKGSAGAAGTTDYTQLSNLPTLGTAAAKNVGTGSGDVAAGTCPAVNAAFIQALGAVIGVIYGETYPPQIFVGTQAEYLASLLEGFILLDTNS